MCRWYVRPELFQCVGLPDGTDESAAFRIDADDTDAHTVADLDRIGHSGAKAYFEIQDIVNRDIPDWNLVEIEGYRV